MYVTIEAEEPTVKDERSSAYMDLLQLNACITLRIFVDDCTKEPDPAVLVVVEQLVHVDTAPQIQNNAIINGVRGVFKWIECTNVAKPLFTIKNTDSYSSSSVRFDRQTGRSYLRVDIRNVISNNQLQETVRVQFEPPTIETEELKTPLFRFTFYQYSKGKQIHDPMEWVPPFVFGIVSGKDDIKSLVQAYHRIIETFPFVTNALVTTPDNSGFHIKERVRAALNRSGENDYKPLPLPMNLPLAPVIVPQARRGSPESVVSPAYRPKPSKQEEQEVHTPSKKRSAFSMDDIMGGDEDPPTGTTADEQLAAQALLSPFTIHDTNPLKRKLSSSNSEHSDEEGADDSDDNLEIDEHGVEPKTKKRNSGTKLNAPSPAARSRVKSQGQEFVCTVCHDTKEDQIGDIKRQITRSNVHLYQLVFNKKVSCGRVCNECLAEYNSSPCTLCGTTEFKSGTLSLKSDLIPKYEEAFGRTGLQEGKLCRGCYGKFYAYQSKKSTQDQKLNQQL